MISIDKIKIFYYYRDKTLQEFKDKNPYVKIGLLFIAVLAVIAVYELQTSRFQAYFLNKKAKGLTYWMETGPSPSIRFPKAGPYDERLGYTSLPAFINNLTARSFEIASQARFSPELAATTDKGFFTTFNEKSQAGLQILDQNNEVMFAASYPERVYKKIDEVPEVIVKSLLFIENKELLNARSPYLNPAVEWDRLGKAVMSKGLKIVDKDENVPGGSTLATQIEKYKHSPEGLTASVRDKYKQMTSAALRAYSNGEQTLEARRLIILDYINSIPLGAVPGYGQVNGIGDGLYAWYNSDFNFINTSLTNHDAAREVKDLSEWGLAYKEVLSLFLAQRRPSYYLLENHNALKEKTESYIRLIAENGIISSVERDAALQAKLNVQKHISAKKYFSFVERKAANAVRPKLLSLLKIPSLYDLNLLDLTVQSTLDRNTQEDVTGILNKLREPEFTQAAGLSGSHLLGGKDPAKVIYSFTLYESTPGANLLRIQTDNFDQPFNINEGVKLELGSSAKLRTLVTYLEVIASLHKQYSGYSDEELKAVRLSSSDQLSRWAVDYFSNNGDKDLTAMLEAAMQRRYSASPAENFFTGGGVHTFSNYDKKHNHSVLSVQDAFNSSVNLVFIRMMRDIVRYYTYKRQDITELLENVNDPRRMDYLARFADREGKIFVRRFYTKYKEKIFEDAFEGLIQEVRPTQARLAAIFRYVKSDAGLEEFTSFIRSRLEGLTDAACRKLYDDYSPENYSLVDRGYMARIHPLELWTVSYLRSHPKADLGEIIKAGENERQEVYTWLFNTHWKNAQDIRIRTLLEVEAFSEIHKAWKNLKYPFDSLVPSYATSIGSSADRPDALAELVGIILNSGVWYPSRRIQELHFAKGTPYETILKQGKGDEEKVLLPEIASVVKKAMTGVVEKGTARSVHDAFIGGDGKALTVGGKTGTGDNRRDIYGRGGRLINSEAINRTAVFVFFIGDRFFGTITAYVEGTGADEYSFTSMLPVQVLRTLAPKLLPLIEKEDTNAPQQIAGYGNNKIM